jgi:hypothetical protein
MNNREISPVQMHIIEPMMLVFYPPTHVRDKPDALAVLIDSYHKTLRGFSAEVLKQAWQDIVTFAKVWTYPKPSEILEACQRHQPIASHAHGTQTKAEQPWEQRVRLARVAAKDYAQRFKSTPTYTQADAEGWANRLMSYVHDMACAQALAIDGASFIPPDVYAFAPSEAEYQSLAQGVYTAKRNGGVIDVALPVWLLDAMRRQKMASSHPASMAR